MITRNLIKAKELYEFLTPSIDFAQWEEKISKGNILVCDRGVILLDLISATRIMDEYQEVI